MLSAAHRKFAHAYALEANGTKAYLAAFPKSTPAAARSSAPALLAKDSVKAEIKRVRDAADKKAGSAVLTLIEKRTWLARSFRLNVLKFNAKRDGDLVTGVTESKSGKRLLTFESKLAVMRADDNLAGDGSEANSAGTMLSALQLLTHGKPKAVKL